MKKQSIILIILLLVIYACSSPKSENKEEELTISKSETILGKWANISMTVNMKKEGKEDSILLVKEGQWEQTLKIKPILTTFNQDSSFSSEYFTLEGQNFNTTYGKWWIRNDSLVMLSEYGETTYHCNISNNQIRFISKLDWDSDGTLDNYDGIQSKVE